MFKLEYVLDQATPGWVCIGSLSRMSYIGSTGLSWVVTQNGITMDRNQIVWKEVKTKRYRSVQPTMKTVCDFGCPVANYIGKQDDVRVPIVSCAKLVRLFFFCFVLFFFFL